MPSPWTIPTVVPARKRGWMPHAQSGVVKAVPLALGLVAEPPAFLAAWNGFLFAPTVTLTEGQRSVPVAIEPFRADRGCGSWRPWSR